MRFRNTTPFPAFLHREAIDGDRIAAAVILRVTYDLNGNPPAPSREQPWLVSPTPWRSPVGLMEGDASFDRDGCDLILLGEARSADGRPVSTLDVSVDVTPTSGGAAFTSTVRVFGERTWQRAGGALVPSAPQAFERMPLDLAHAFGGVAVFDELPVPHADNRVGKGFYLEEELAEGGALPNLESPEHLIERWSDRPDPVGVGLCPVTFGPRVRRAAVISERSGGTINKNDSCPGKSVPQGPSLLDSGWHESFKDGHVVGVRHAIFNLAFPSFVCPTPEPGAQLSVRGMGPELQFSLPDPRWLAVTRVGGTEHCDPLRIDQIGIEPALGRFFVTYRYTFIYPLRSGEERRCELQWRREPPRTELSCAIGGTP